MAEARASVAKHPIHPMLVVIPLGLWTAALALGLKIASWLAALIVGGVLLVAAALLGYIGWKRMVTNPLALTRQTLKEDVRWVKERLA